ncbi:MAG: histidine phosphatase family protein [Bacteroidota bacterium]
MSSKHHKEIYIIRHGETDFNRQRIVQGSGIDSSLNDLGHAQARAFHTFYQSVPFELVITSNLQRTHQTVAPFTEQGLIWEQTPWINEINWGVHEGKKSEPWMIEAYRSMIQEWGRGNFDARLREGESARELAQRLEQFVDHLRQRPEATILVCSHGRALRCLMCLLKGQHLREMESYAHSNTGLFKVRQDGDDFIVDLENDIRHLQTSAFERL